MYLPLLIAGHKETRQQRPSRVSREHPCPPALGYVSSPSPARVAAPSVVAVVSEQDRGKGVESTPPCL